MRQFLVTTTLLMAVMFSVLATRCRYSYLPADSWVLNVAKSTLPRDNTMKSRTIVIENKKVGNCFPLQNRRQEVDGNL